VGQCIDDIIQGGARMSLKITWEGPLAWLEFDHGKANEMGRAQLEALEALAEEAPQRGARALISFSRRVTSRGTPIFIAGANVTEREGWSDEAVAAHVRYQRAVLARVRALPLLHVAVVNGVALGWGTEWLITADYRIAAPQARFGLPETGLGIVPGAGGTSELHALIGPAQALRLGMTGEQIDAAEAARIGLVQEVAADLDAGLERARALAALVARRSPTAVAAFKAGVLASIGAGPERVEIEARAYERCLYQGEAAIGRAHFKAATAGEAVPWGPLTPPGA
jgi:enoyl-CoA hydratase/carnithine racemase